MEKVHGKTVDGKPNTDDLIEELAEKAEAGYDVEETLRRRGRQMPVVLCASLLCLGAAFPAGSAASSLGKGQARSAAAAKALGFAKARSWLDSAKVQRCARKDRLRFDCLALATGETETRRSTCRLTVVVRAQRRSPRGATATVARSRCRSSQLPVLTYAAARDAIKGEADRLAGQPTAIASLRREGRAYVGLAQWERLAASAEACTVEISATLLRDGKVRLEVGSPSCA